jgi:hypothetical protein
MLKYGIETEGGGKFLWETEREVRGRGKFTGEDWIIRGCDVVCVTIDGVWIGYWIQITITLSLFPHFTIH